jgi:hypothetical protein
VNTEIRAREPGETRSQRAQGKGGGERREFRGRGGSFGDEAGVSGTGSLTPSEIQDDSSAKRSHRNDRRKVTPHSANNLPFVPFQGTSFVGKILQRAQAKAGQAKTPVSLRK